MFQRYAVYYTPRGTLAEKGAAWLGWDLVTGSKVAHPAVAGLDVAALTRRPHKYGFHATIKPPFFLSSGTTADMLAKEVETLCAHLPAVTLETVEVQTHAQFIALVPMGTQDGLASLAAEVVTALDHFRAAPSEAELARRKQANLTLSQARNVDTWGYPYVMDDFNFHITLTGRIKGDTAQPLAALRQYFAPEVPAPLDIDALTLAGQDDAGMFHALERFALLGRAETAT